MELDVLKSNLLVTKNLIKAIEEKYSETNNGDEEQELMTDNLISEMTISMKNLSSGVNTFKKVSTSIVDMFYSERNEQQMEIQALRNEIVNLTQLNQTQRDEFYHKMSVYDEERKIHAVSESKMKDQLQRASAIIEYQREEYDKMRKKLVSHDDACIEPLLTAIWQMTSHEEIISEVVGVTDSFIHVVFGILKNCVEASNSGIASTKATDRLASCIGIFVNLTACNSGLVAIYNCQSEGLQIIELIASMISNLELLHNKYLRRLTLDILNNLSNSKETIVVMVIDNGGIGSLCKFLLSEKDSDLRHYAAITIRSIIKYAENSSEPIKQTLNQLLFQLRNQKIDISDFNGLERDITAMK